MPDTQKFPIAWKTWDSVFKNIDKFLGYANMKNFRGKKKPGKPVRNPKTWPPSCIDSEVSGYLHS